MDTNLLFLFMSVAFATLALFQLLHVRPTDLLWHALAPSLVLLAAAASYLLAPASAGYAALAAYQSRKWTDQRTLRTDLTYFGHFRRAAVLVP